MWHHNSFRLMVIALVTLLGCLIIAPPRKLLAQGGDRSKRQDEIHVFKGGGSLMLWLRPAKGNKYLIDCSVESASPNAHFVVTGPNGTAPLQVDAIAGGQHLIFVLDATDNKWQPFQITGTGTKSQYGISSNVDWTFYSCEVTNL